MKRMSVSEMCIESKEKVLDARLSQAMERARDSEFLESYQGNQG